MLSGKVFYIASSEAGFDWIIDEPVARLDESVCPEYVMVFATACGIATTRTTCTLEISPDCVVRANMPSMSYDEEAISSGGLWVSLDGIAYGGYDFSTEARIYGSAEIGMQGKGAVVQLM